MKRAGLLALVTCVAVVAAAAVALAHDKTYNTKTTLNVGSESLTGKVKSPKKACEKNRLVRGEFETIGTRIPLGPVRTDGQGNWEIPFETGSGSYRITAIVVKKTLKNTSAHRHVCDDAAKAKTVG